METISVSEKCHTCGIDSDYADMFELKPIGHKNSFYECHRCLFQRLRQMSFDDTFMISLFSTVRPYYPWNSKFFSGVESDH
jgi:hypothetical protein